jgi:hypothetical protein
LSPPELSTISSWPGESAKRVFVLEVPAIHVLMQWKMWIPATSAGMTDLIECRDDSLYRAHPKSKSKDCMIDIAKRLQAISFPPTAPDAYQEWLKQADALAFLEQSALETDLIIYAGVGCSYLHAVTVPADTIEPIDVPDLSLWNGNPWSSWGIQYSFSDSPTVEMVGPLSGYRSKTLEKGEQLIFCRDFDGRQIDRRYIEISQRFSQIVGIHYVAERRAFSRYDDHGEIDDVVQIINVPANGDSNRGGTVVTFRKGDMDEYLALTDSVLIRMFDFSRLRIGRFSAWNIQREETMNRGDIYARAHFQHDASYMRGFQIIRPLTSKVEILTNFRSGRDEQKKYATFIAQDWKNNQIAEMSCDPKCLASYFVESDMPFQITPAFFKPEVLLRYKSHPEKYDLGERSITCRNAWTLKTYDINDSGQVHTYLIYLSHLPYEEQLYWRSFNEAPKAPISERAFTTDMRGEVYFGYDALMSLKSRLRKLEERSVEWWSPRSEGLIDQVHYPVTTSSEEWASELLSLDKLIVEGLQEKWLRGKAQSLGQNPDPRLRSLGLLEEVLVGLGFEQSHAKDILKPWRELHELRSQMKGHAGGETATARKKSILLKHGTYQEHFKQLCADCDETLKQIMNAFRLSPPGAKET